MPKLLRTQSNPLSVPKLRALKILAENPQTSVKLAESGGGISGLQVSELEKTGLVKAEILDLDGISERIYRITPAGRAAMVDAVLPPIENIRTDKITALVPWFGSARGQAAQVGEAVRGCKWAGVPFAGSLCEIPAMIRAKVCSVSVNDAHANLINLARVAADAKLGPALYRRLRRQAFTETVLIDAQEFFSKVPYDPGEEWAFNAAFAYFICAWAGRNGKAGTDGELKGGLSVRWSASGGDSALRFSGAAWSLRDWRLILSRCTMFCIDWREFLGKCQDKTGHAIYADPPWPGAGNGYVHKFDNAEHSDLAVALSEFRNAMVVLRTGDFPLMRELYDGWEWRRMLGRNQAGKTATEYLVIRNG